jgi:formylglycine-generating enzyme required for sulfatase activity
MAYFMSTTHWLDAMTPPLAAHLKQLCQTVQALLPTLGENRNPQLDPLAPASAHGVGTAGRSDAGLRETTAADQSAVRTPWKRVQRVFNSKRTVLPYILAAAVVLLLWLAWVLRPAVPQQPAGPGAKAKSQNHGPDFGSERLSEPPQEKRMRLEPNRTEQASSVGTRPGESRDINSLPSDGTDAGIARLAGKQVANDSSRTQLVLIVPGSFTMGSPQEEQRSNDEGPVKVTLTKSFWLGRDEVTQAEWKRLMQSTPWSGRNSVTDGGDYPPTYVTKDGDGYPATYVSWEDAMKFCDKLTQIDHRERRLPEDWQYTLPTEAQWEYACRGGTTSRFSFGDDESELGDYACFAKNADDVGEKYAHLVGQKKSNRWGLYDMHGNVDEWCRDVYVKNLPGGVDPETTAGSSSRVVRGGCWHFIAGGCRSASRGKFAQDVRRCDVGFRVALCRSAKSR